MDILGSALIPVLRISLVDGENVASLWDGHVRIGQNKLSHSLRIRKQHVTKYIRLIARGHVTYWLQTGHVTYGVQSKSVNP